MIPRRPALAVAASLLPFLGSAAGRAESPNPSFYLVNQSRQAITEVYVSPVRADGWGRDRLGDSKIAPAATAPIRLLADGTCVFDLRVVFEDGRDEERRAVNTCNVDNINFGAPASPATPVPSGNPAHDPSFRIVNRSHREIDEVYARIAGSSAWGRDRLGDATIDADSYRVIPLPKGQCNWDVKIVFEDGQATEKRRLNLCDITDLPVP